MNVDESAPLAIISAKSGAQSSARAPFFRGLHAFLAKAGNQLEAMGLSQILKAGQG